MYMDTEYINNTDLEKINPNDNSHWKKDNLIFLEKEVVEALKLVTDEKLKYKFDNDCRNFNVEICEKLSDRHNFKEDYTTYVECIEPINATSKEFRIKYEDLNKLLKQLPKLTKISMSNIWLF